MKYLNGSQIIGEETNGNITFYLYDASGTKLVPYVYDAWGNFSTSYHNGAAADTAPQNSLFDWRCT